MGITNPFREVIQQFKLMNSELVESLCLDLAAEQEIEHICEAHDNTSDYTLAKNVIDIDDEERVHTREFFRLINTLLKNEDRIFAECAEEVNERASSFTIGQQNRHLRNMPRNLTNQYQ